MNAIWILTKLTFREAMRRSIMLAGLVLGVGFLIVYSVGLHFIINQLDLSIKAGVFENAMSQSAANIIKKQAMNGFLMSGLYATTFLSIAMAALLGADTLAGEINSGTIQTITTKPIRRADIVLGKWLGFAGLLGLYVLLMAGGIVLSMFVQSEYMPNNVWRGLGLIYTESILIMTLTLMFSAVFPSLATGGIVFGLYGLSFIGGWIEEIGVQLQNDTAVKIGILTSLINPSESLWKRAAFEMQSPLMGAFRVSPFGTLSVPSSLMIVYAFVYIAIILLIAVRIFQKRDL